MTEQNVSDALRSATAARRNGKLLEARRFYAYIINERPEHPDANYYLGVIEVWRGAVKRALPSLKTALQASPNTAQYWVSYIDALLDAEMLIDAKTVFDQAVERGVTGEGFKQLEKKLIEAYEVVDPPKNVIQSIADLHSKGLLEQALHHIKTLIQQYPRSATLHNINGIVLHELGRLDFSILAYRKAISIRPNNSEFFYNIGNAFRDKKQDKEAIQAYCRAIILEPMSGKVLNNLGLILLAQRRYKLSLKIFKKALSVQKEFYVAYNNMGRTYHKIGQLDEALCAYKKTIAIKPDFAEAHNNLGNIYKDMGLLSEAVISYQRAIKIKPNFSAAFNNIGNAYKEQGRLVDATKAYAYALTLDPVFIRAAENLINLQVQSISSNLIEEIKLDFTSEMRQKLNSSPKFHIYNAISSFLTADIEASQRHLKHYNNLDQKIVDKLDPRDKLFASAYCNFLTKLNENSDNFALANEFKQTFYHIGESHCLSFAYNTLNVAGIRHTIVPKLVIGAKAFHFSMEIDNKYKAIVRAHMDTIPEGKSILLSFGEIDCRPNQGFKVASIKLDKSIEDCIHDTVDAYINWFYRQNMNKKNSLFFLNVPAPVYRQKLSEERNIDVSRTVSVYNKMLEISALKYGFSVIDVYSTTVGINGFSNEKFHVDQVHLNSKMLPEIERQVSALKYF